MSSSHRHTLPSSVLMSSQRMTEFIPSASVCCKGPPTWRSVCPDWVQQKGSATHLSVPPSERLEAQINQHFGLKLQTSLAENRSRRAGCRVTRTARNKHTTCSLWPYCRCFEAETLNACVWFLYEWLWWWKEHINLPDKQTVFVFNKQMQNRFVH